MEKELICSCDRKMREQLERNCRKGNWLVVPMEEMKGHSMIDLRQKWRTIMRNLEKECAGYKTSRTDNITEAERVLEDSLLIYWRLPDLIRRRRKWGGSVQIWLRAYDTPLLHSLVNGYSRAATVFIEELIESCREELQEGDSMYLTGQIPFALQRLGIYPQWADNRKIEGESQKIVRDILQKHFIRRGKEMWRPWLEYLEGKYVPGTYLATESLDQEGGWQMLAIYCGMETEVPGMIRISLEQGKKFRNSRRDGRELYRRVEEMIRIWECKDVKEIEELLCLMIYCRVIETPKDSALTSLLGGGKIEKD